jgi:hypothetical protein
MKDGWAGEDGVSKQMDAGTISSRDIFGTREHLNNNYAYRMVAAVWGIYGNSARSHVSFIPRDAGGAPLDGSHKYTLRFEKDQLPPVNAFWSVTMYEMPASLLYDNALDRLSHQLVHAAEAQEGQGREPHHLHSARLAGTEAPVEWLPAPAGAFRDGDASVLAQTRSPRRHLEGRHRCKRCSSAY